MKRIFYVVLIALLVALSGCVGGSQKTKVSANNTVEIKSFNFEPQTITVKKGTTITWINDDPAPHTVTSDDGKFTGSGQLDKGDSYSVTFNDLGTFNYHCAVHPTMHGVVQVVE